MATGARRLEPYDQGYRDGWHDIHVSPLRRRKRRRQRSAEYALGYQHGRTDGATWGQYPEWAGVRVGTPRHRCPRAPRLDPSRRCIPRCYLARCPARRRGRRRPGIRTHPSRGGGLMGRRGPARAPDAAKLRKGETRPSRLNGLEPLPRHAAPRMPKGMDEAARRVWRRVLRGMRGSGLIVAADTDILRCYRGHTMADLTGGYRPTMTR